MLQCSRSFEADVNKINPRDLSNFAIPFGILMIFSGCAILFPLEKPEKAEKKVKVMLTEKGPSVWDSRDPEVVYAEGMVEGWEGGTYNVLVGISRGALQWFEARRDTEGMRKLVRFQQELVFFHHQLRLVKSNPAFGKTITPSNSEIQRLKAQLQKTTELVFPVLRRVAETGGVLGVSKNGIQPRHAPAQ